MSTPTLSLVDQALRANVAPKLHPDDARLAQKMGTGFAPLQQHRSMREAHEAVQAECRAIVHQPMERVEVLPLAKESRRV